MRAYLPGLLPRFIALFGEAERGGGYELVRPALGALEALGATLEDPLPLLLPAVFLALVLRMMDAFRVFDSIYVTTGGGPAGATDTLMVLAVKRGLQFFDIGSAAAIGNVMIVCLGVIAALFVLVIRQADRVANGR